MLMLLVWSCKTWNVVKPGATLQGFNSLRTILPRVRASLALKAGGHSQGSVQAG